MYSMIESQSLGERAVFDPKPGASTHIVDTCFRMPVARPRVKELILGKKIYVGNLSYNTTEDRLRTVFQAYGEVASAKIITDRDTGSSKGFGFVEMSSDGEANAAIDGTNGSDLDEIGRAHV